VVATSIGTREVPGAELACGISTPWLGRLLHPPTTSKQPEAKTPATILTHDMTSFSAPPQHKPLTRSDTVQIAATHVANVAIFVPGRITHNFALKVVQEMQKAAYGKQLN